MSGSATFELSNAQAEQVCRIIMTAGGAASGLIVGGASAATIGTGGLALLFLAGALIGLSAGRFFCGAIVAQTQQNQATGMTSEDMNRFRVLMLPYGSFTDAELLRLARAGYQYNALYGAAPQTSLPPPDANLQAGLRAVLQAYTTV